MSDQTIEESLKTNCNRKAHCKGYGIHHPDCKRLVAANAKYHRRKAVA